MQKHLLSKPLIEIISSKTEECEFTFSDFPEQFEDWPTPPPTNDLLLMCSGTSYYVEAGCCIVEFNIICQKFKDDKGKYFSTGSVIEKIDMATYGGKTFTKQEDKTTFRNMGFGYEVNKNDLDIHPNPTDGRMKITGLNSNDVINIELFDEKGRLVEMKKEFRNGDNLDLSHLPTGLYFVKFLDSNNESSVKKIVINR